MAKTAYGRDNCDGERKTITPTQHIAGRVIADTVTNRKQGIANIMF